MENANRILYGVVFGVIAISILFFRTDQGPPPNDGWFQKAVLESPHPVVVKFGAEWCGPCRGMDEAIGIFSATALSGM